MNNKETLVYFHVITHYFNKIYKQKIDFSIWHFWIDNTDLDF